MTEFEFTIIASGMDPEVDDFESRFYDAGCDDATISFQNGHVIVDFTREQASASEAVSSAIADVRRAGATVDRVEPDPLVSLSDIATRTGKTRQSISLYAKGKRRNGFPAPVMKVTSDSPLWRWSDVARWFADLHEIDADVALFAETIERANHTIQLEGMTAAEQAEQRTGT